MVDRKIRIKSPDEVGQNKPSREVKAVLRKIATEINEAQDPKIDFEIDNIYRDTLSLADREFIGQQLAGNGWTVKLTFSSIAGTGPLETGERNFLKIKLRPRKP